MSNISSDFPTRQPAPKIGSNGNWWEWDELTGDYVDTGRPSRGDSAGLSDDIKTALLTLAQKAAYVDEHGQDYYDALYAALYPPAELLSITASFAQGSHTVYDTDTLDSLKPYLTVTGAYDDGTSRTITSYTLSGTLTEGTSSITVTANSKTTTFTVSVTHKVAQVTGISAVFTQGSAVIYDNASLDDLKPYLVVTASYDDETSAAVSGYTLSGTLAAGTSTITASYSGFTDTFTVTVTERPVTLVSISAVFTQGQNVVYDKDSLDTLKQYLVVTAHYDDNTDTVVSNYTLSGTLTAGTSTITANYGGKTDTFSVSVTAETLFIDGYSAANELTSSLKYNPLIYDSSYNYDYTKKISSIELEVTNTGVLSIGYQDGSTIVAGGALHTEGLHIYEQFTISEVGFHRLVFSSPMQLEDGQYLCVGTNTDDICWKYGTSSAQKGFIYLSRATNKYAKDPNRGGGINVYVI